MAGLAERLRALLADAVVHFERQRPQPRQSGTFRQDDDAPVRDPVVAQIEDLEVLHVRRTAKGVDAAIAEVVGAEVEFAHAEQGPGAGDASHLPPGVDELHPAHRGEEKEHLRDLGESVGLDGHAVEESATEGALAHQRLDGGGPLRLVPVEEFALAVDEGLAERVVRKEAFDGDLDANELATGVVAFVQPVGVD